MVAGFDRVVWRKTLLGMKLSGIGYTDALKKSMTNHF